MELPWEVPQQLRRVLHHPMLKQLLWLPLWACMSLSAIYANRVLVHYHDFAAPWFLALMSAGAVAIAARLLVFLTAADDGSSGKDWLHLCLTGVIMWASVALNIASLRTLPVPMILLIQVSTVLAVLAWWCFACGDIHGVSGSALDHCSIWCVSTSATVTLEVQQQQHQQQQPGVSTKHDVHAATEPAPSLQ